jgi:hypothetical protein
MIYRFVLLVLSVLILAHGPILGASKDETSLRVAIYNESALSDEKTGTKKMRQIWNWMGYYDCFDPDREKCKRGFERRYDMLVKPVLEEIHAEIKEISLRNNVVILDGVKLEEDGKMLAWDPDINITAKLIEALDQYAESKKYSKIQVRAGSIGSLDTKNANFVEMSKEWNPTEKYAAFQKYALKSGIVLILDKSLPVPAELKEFRIEDITWDFIEKCKSAIGRPSC